MSVVVSVKINQCCFAQARKRAPTVLTTEEAFTPTTNIAPSAVVVIPSTRIVAPQSKYCFSCTPSRKPQLPLIDTLCCMNVVHTIRRCRSQVRYQISNK